MMLCKWETHTTNGVLRGPAMVQDPIDTLLIYSAQEQFYQPHFRNKALSWWRPQPHFGMTQPAQHPHAGTAQLGVPRNQHLSTPGCFYYFIYLFILYILFFYFIFYLIYLFYSFSGWKFPP